MSELVFTPQWTETAAKRNRHLPRSQKLWPYLVATDSEFLPLRNQIEEWVAGFSIETREKVIPKLLSDENFWHTCHELAVGTSLKRIGLEVEFEKQFGKQTPDWFACSKDRSQSFIVEIFTANVPKEIDFENKLLQELTRRLAAIPLGFLIRISCENSSVIEKLTPHKSKKIAEAVEGWLQAYKLFPEPSFSTDGFDFEVVESNRGFPTLQYGEPVKNIYAPIPLLRKKIKEKISKYKTLALTYHIPLVVAVTRGLGADYSNFEIKKILNDDIFSALPRGDGLFVKETLLSGCFFVWRTSISEWAIRAYRNPNAAFPIAEDFFVKLTASDAFDPHFDSVVPRQSGDILITK